MNKIIFSLLTAMLAVVMLLPFTACNTEKSGETGTTAATTEANIPTEQPTDAVTLPSSEQPAGEEMTSPLYIEGRGNLIPHTEAMLALKSKWESSDEAWTEKITEEFFQDVYENDHVRDGDRYHIIVSFAGGVEVAAIEQELCTLVDVQDGDHFGYVNLSPDVLLVSMHATAEEIETIAKNMTDKIWYFSMNSAQYPG